MGKLREGRREKEESSGLSQVYFTLIYCLFICLNLVDAFYYFLSAAATSLADSEGDCRL